MGQIKMSNAAAWVVGIVAVGTATYLLWIYTQKLPLGWPFVAQAKQATQTNPAPQKLGLMPTGFPREWEVTA
ncbi:unnamed protein product [marine sediment metagenome]|uniref:Uncharacterized protein n=1 Tax=marine sediment metagenome TaxID=412755 RepID=X1VBX3_9ZZZZ